MMAIDTPARHIYKGDGFTRVFPIPTYIRGDDYIRIEIDGEYQVDRSLWDIVNNSIIFTIAPIDNSIVDVQVATSIETLTQLGSSTNMDIVAENIDSINSIVTNIVPNIDNVDIVATNVNKVITVADDTVAINEIYNNRLEIYEADNNALIATSKASEASTSASNAQLSVWEAEAEAMTSESYSTEAVDTFVKEYTSNGDGSFSSTNTTDYSASHWAYKAKVDAQGGAVNISYDNSGSGFTATNVQDVLDEIDDIKMDKDITSLTNKTTPADADEMIIADSTSSFSLKKMSFSNLKTILKTYFDTLYNNFVANDSRVKTALNASGDAPIYACRAWVNFNGTGTVAINGSGNVSSITDKGTGVYDVNFITEMSDINYQVGSTPDGNSTNAVSCWVHSPKRYDVNGFEINVGLLNGTPFDPLKMSVSVIR